ncbi:Uncharacterized protein ESCO_005730 [Escovopsis weberi]|uniref:Beta-catenin-like protein 1 N-terminal domain-containing protein n=1 Tax=Escovopsis weberi TaxID=150374 RepID=A0A0M8N4T4_ESCWE|nr:Uncharacterized protein ESCO_005730 [Escovopsis weberi]
MASIDEIFKNSGVSNKRKLEQPIRDPNEIYKTSKLSENGSDRRAHAADAADAAAEDANGGDDEDADFGPELPPEDGDDEEGRFFGGGISSKEAEILDFIDKNDNEADADAKIDAAWLRKAALGLERLVTRNAELRAKFEDQPQKFIASEADLDAEIMRLSIVSQHPALYPELVRLGTAATLAGLLAHENTDIAIDAVTIIHELTDDDTHAADEQWDPLADALLDADLLGLLASNLARLDEADESDRSGVYYALGVLENLCSRGPTAVRIGGDERLLGWLLGRLRRSENGGVSQNKQYAAEVLALLAQASPACCARLAGMDAVDQMLQMVAPYRRRDPDPLSNEEELVENVFEVLTCLVDEPAGKAEFLRAEGTELCLLMVRESKAAKPSALRLLDHAVGGGPGADVCARVVREGGLKALFTLFMKTPEHGLHTHMLSIFAAMLRSLPADSAERIRLLAKFVEKDYEKIAKLLVLRRDFGHRIRAAEDAFRQENGLADGEEPADEEGELALLSRRIDAGLFRLEFVDVILAWLVAEDAGARRRIKALLAERDEDLRAVRRTLQGKLDALDRAEEENQDMGDMLSTLIDFL